MTDGSDLPIQLRHPGQDLAEPSFRIGPGVLQTKTGLAQHSGNGMKGEFVAILGMNTLAAGKVEGPGQILDPYDLFNLALQVHFDPRLAAVPKSHMHKGGEVELSAQFAIDASQHVFVETG